MSTHSNMLAKYGLLVWLFSVGIEVMAQSPEEDIQDYFSSSAEQLEDGEISNALEFLDQAYFIAQENSLDTWMSRIDSRRGVIMQNQGYFNQALQFQLKALRVAETLGPPELHAQIVNIIGSIHHSQKNYGEAQIYYEQCLSIRETISDKRSLARSYNNFGALYEDMGRLDDALLMHNNCLDIWRELADTGWVAITYTNIGSCIESKGDLDSALTLYQLSLDLMELKGRNRNMGHVMSKMGNVFIAKNQPQEALKWCKRSQTIAEKWNASQSIEEACYCQYRAHEQLGNVHLALNMYKKYIQYKDSVHSNDLAREITKLDMKYKFSQQILADSLEAVEEKMKAQFAFEASLAEERERKNLVLIGGIAILLLAGGLWSRLQYISKTKKTIQIERERSEDLLLNILPASVAEELKSTGRSTARDYESVTVLFTDFKGFTAMSEQVSPQELVRDLNACFSEFDKIVEKYGVEKIKTIGDAYMAVGGLPTPNDSHTKDVINAAFEMRDFVAAGKKRKIEHGLPYFEIRIGIHTGPVVAGIVGVKKFQYDIWGDTVNTASRMESSGEIGKVNISEATYELVKDSSEFSFSARGKIKAKGKGEMEMYFVSHSI